MDKAEEKTKKIWDKNNFMILREGFSQPMMDYNNFKKAAEQIRSDAINDVINKLLSYEDLSGVDIIAEIRNLKGGK